MQHPGTSTLSHTLAGTMPPGTPVEGGRRRVVAAAILFAAFSVWINYEVKFVLPNFAGTVAALGDLKIGTQAPAFRLSDLAGTTVELDSMRGDKIVLVEFWATWCPPCRMVLATLRRMEQTLREDNVEVLSVNQREAPEQVRQFVAKEGIPFHVVLDPDGAVSASYRVTSLPTMVLVDRRGTVRWIHVGHMPETDELRDILQRVAKE
jgi:peroxiredoxin